MSIQVVSKKVAKLFLIFSLGCLFARIRIANKFAKFHGKILNQSENMPKSFRGNTFLNTLYSGHNDTVGLSVK